MILVKSKNDFNVPCSIWVCLITLPPTFGSLAFVAAFGKRQPKVSTNVDSITTVELLPSAAITPNCLLAVRCSSSNQIKNTSNANVLYFLKRTIPDLVPPVQ